MSNKLNFSRNIALEKEELIQLQNFLTDNSQKELFKAITESWGIIPQASLSGNDFLVTQGSDVGSIQIQNDGVGIDSDSLLLALSTFDNYPISDDGSYYWLKISHRYLNVEPGVVSVNISGEVSGTDTTFTELLRNQTTGSPIKIKFYQENVEQVEQTINNDDVYEIVEVVNDGSMILAGDFVAESNLNYIIIGSASIGTTLTSQQKEGIYSYNNCTLELVAETVTDTPPTTGFTQGKDFYIARVRRVSSTVTIIDKRDNYYWTIDLGVTLPSKADIDADNITTADILLWLTKLMVYQNDYLALTATVTPTIFDLGDIHGLVNVSGSAATFSYTLRLPIISNQNKGKIIIIKYDLITTSSSASSFNIVDFDSDNVFTESWAVNSSKMGLVFVKNNGTSWSVVDLSKFDALSTIEVAGIIEKATPSEAVSAAVDKNITADNLPSVTAGLLTKIIDIGDWNMDANDSKSVTHGLTNYKNIREVSVIIRDDVDNLYYPLITVVNEEITDFEKHGGGYFINSTSVILKRIIGGIFANQIFNLTPYNRGWVTIKYLA